MHNLTFEEAARLWPHVSAGPQSGASSPDALDACEAVILNRSISTPTDAFVVCQVLLNNLIVGQRTDELDLKAMTSLRDWLQRASAPGLTARRGDDVTRLSAASGAGSRRGRP